MFERLSPNAGADCGLLVPPPPKASLSVRRGSEMGRTFEKAQHPGCRMDRQSVRGVARPRQNAGCHLADDGELSSGCFPEQRNHQVFEGDHTNLNLDELGIAQRWNAGSCVGREKARGQSAGTCTAFVIPLLKGRLEQRGSIQGIEFSFMHGESRPVFQSVIIGGSPLLTRAQRGMQSLHKLWAL